MGGKRKKHKPTYKPKEQQKERPQQEITEPTIEQSEPPLVIFISSLIDKMMTERDAVDQAIQHIPITRTWRFERTPASSQPVEESYLSKVHDCDIFVLILGPDYSEAVAREYHTAVESNKPVLAFVKKGERSPEQNELVRLLGTKYAPYINSDDLARVVVASVFDEMVRRFKSTLKSSALTGLIESLPASVRKPEEVSGYVLVGIQDQTLEQVFKFFDVEPPPDDLESIYPSYEQVYFDNFAEMKEVFAALSKAAKKAQQASGERQKAYLRAFKEEAIQLASQYIIRKRSGKKAPQLKVEGIDYIIWALAPDIARLTSIMRPAQMREGPTPVHRTKHEYLFKSAQYLLDVFSAISQAGEESGDDDDEFLRLIIVSAMRMRVPEIEDYEDTDDRE